MAQICTTFSRRVTAKWDKKSSPFLRENLEKFSNFSRTVILVDSLNNFKTFVFLSFFPKTAFKKVTGNKKLNFWILESTRTLPKNFTLTAHHCGWGVNCVWPQLRRVDSAKSLGIMIDCHVKWDEHIICVTKKLRYLLFVFYKLRDCSSIGQLLQIYHGLFGSVAYYGIIAWGVCIGGR